MMNSDFTDCKVLRDPIYGYVSIPTDVFDTIIDQAPFQRLRRIRQTSYEPLYSAALHNRFTHSIGVYHLGCLAFAAFRKSAEPLDLIDANKWERLQHVFTSACLLHDVGHAPFSHTGEDAFKKSSPEECLMAEIGCEAFSNGITQTSAAPHEFMSAYLALVTFPGIFELKDEKGQFAAESPEEKTARIKAEKELFARCIIGHLYVAKKTPKGELEPLSPEQELNNCLISLLNSTIIDVDRLDYVIRDSYVSGFQNMSIDYQRLLSSIRIARRDNAYHLAYHKNALSIIENVIFANDAEKKWIQNHPVVLYEHFLVQHAIFVVNKYYEDLRNAEQPVADGGSGDVSALPSLFTYESLSKEGNTFGPDLKISLLSDDDIIYSIKNIPKCATELTSEYFSRSDRRHAVWKSEAEFRALFEQVLGPSALDDLETLFANIDKELRNLDYPYLPIINDDFLQYCQDQQEKLKTSDLVEREVKDIREFCARAIPFLTEMKRFMEESDFKFDFVYVPAKQFHSTFGKTGINNILIDYPKFKKAYYIREISTIFDIDSGRDNFFYLFYARRKKNDSKTSKKIDPLSFSRRLCETLLHIPVAST